MNRLILLLRVALFLVVTAAMASASILPASFFTLSGHPDAIDMSFAYGMSADGNSIVGETPTDYIHGEGAVADRQQDGSWLVRRLGLFPLRQNDASPAFAASRNGSVLAGYGSYGNPEVSMPWVSFARGPLVPLGLFSGDVTGVPFAVTA